MSISLFFRTPFFPITPGPLYNTVRLIQHGFGYNTDHSWTPYGIILLYIYIFYSCYNTDWIANMEIVLDPNNSVIKRLRCMCMLLELGTL